MFLYIILFLTDSNVLFRGINFNNSYFKLHTDTHARARARTHTHTHPSL